jgi:hypothetical protein
MLKRMGIPILLLFLAMLALPQTASSRVHVRVFAGIGPTYTYSVPYYGYYGYPAYEYPRYYYRPYYRTYSYAPYYWGGYGWRWHHHHWR